MNIGYYALMLCILGVPNPKSTNTRLYPNPDECLRYMISGQWTEPKIQMETEQIQMLMF